MGETPGDAGPAVALTVTMGDDPLFPPVMLTATVPGGGGGGLSSGATCTSEQVCIST